MGTFVLILLTITGLFLIFIILLQRGRGGGLAGALGGAGGQSAFGTKAGDVFTRITIGVVLVWVLLACVSIFAVTPETKFPGGDAAQKTAPGMSAASTEEEDGQGQLEDDDSTLDNFLKAEDDGEDLDSISEETKPLPETPSPNSDQAEDKK